MDQAILVALVMLVCVLTMLVLGIPISISIGLASTIAMLCVLDVYKRQQWCRWRQPAFRQRRQQTEKV